MPSPELWIVAGPNGAGKTTLVQGHPILELLPRVRFLNPDDFARDLLMRCGHAGFGDAPEIARREAFLQAAKMVEVELKAGLLRGEAIGVETVLSTDKYRLAVEDVRTQGGFVGLIYVACHRPNWRAGALRDVFAPADTMSPLIRSRPAGIGRYRTWRGSPNVPRHFGSSTTQMSILSIPRSWSRPAAWAQFNSWMHRLPQHCGIRWTTFLDSHRLECDEPRDRIRSRIQASAFWNY